MSDFRFDILDTLVIEGFTQVYGEVGLILNTGGGGGGVGAYSLLTVRLVEGESIRNSRQIDTHKLVILI